MSPLEILLIVVVLGLIAHIAHLRAICKDQEQEIDELEDDLREVNDLTNQVNKLKNKENEN